MVDQYWEMIQELKILREKFLKAVASNDEKNARTYSTALKDYRSIQVKLILALQKTGALGEGQDAVAGLFSKLSEMKEEIEVSDLAKFIQKLDEKLRNGEIDSDTHSKVKAVLNKDLEEVTKKIELKRQASLQKFH